MPALSIMEEMRRFFSFAFASLRAASFLPSLEEAYSARTAFVPCVRIARLDRL